MRNYREGFVFDDRRQLFCVFEFDALRLVSIAIFLNKDDYYHRKSFILKQSCAFVWTVSS